MFSCPLFRYFRYANKSAKLKGPGLKMEDVKMQGQTTSER